MAQDKLEGMRRSYQDEAVKLLQRLQELRELPSLPGISYSEEIKKIQERLESLRNRDTSGAAWKIVQLARHQDRPQTLDYVAHGLSDFLELHGDRLGADDGAIVAGLGILGERRVAVIGHQRGHNLKERQERTFGMAHPSGYRKAQRVARLAEKFGLPVVTLVDTMGAYPGRDAEEGGQARAIAHSMEIFANLAVPTVTVVIGEGGSGGALALAVTDRVFMLENSIYSVMSPEGCAAILWRDSAEAPQAAEALKLTAANALELGLIDGVIPEPKDGAQTDHPVAARRLWREVNLALGELERLDNLDRLHFRRAKYLAVGSYRTVE
ncbi:MAG TPA: acetyl-CoA carboxylase carboxyltransferase subunit alpha [Thermoleophilia bacterium]